MSEGRFLIGLREMELSERVLLTTRLLKESVDIFDENLRKENMDKSLLILVDNKLNALSTDLESCILNKERVEVAAVIIGYISKVIFDKSKCEVCKILLTTSKSDSNKFNYLNKLSRGELSDSIHRSSTLSCRLVCYFILYCISDIIKKSLLPERKLAKYVISERNDYPSSFLCRIISTC